MQRRVSRRRQRRLLQLEKKFGSKISFGEPRQHWLDRHEAEQEDDREQLRKRQEANHG